jgi:hypothetical protein
MADADARPSGSRAEEERPGPRLAMDSLGDNRTQRLLDAASQGQQAAPEGVAGNDPLGRDNERRRVISWIWTGVASIFYTLAAYNIFLVLLLLKLNDSAQLSWATVCLPILVLQGLAICRETVKYSRSRRQTARSPYIFAHKELHAVCFGLSTFLVALRLELIIHPSVRWSVLLTPMWVDACVGTALLWFAPLPADRNEGLAAQEQRRSLFHAGLFHFTLWGVQVMLITLKLDELVTGGWSNVFCPSFLILIMVVVFLCGTSLHLFVTMCPMIFRFSTISRAGKMIVVELATILILSWSWIICLFHSFNMLIILLSGDTSEVDYSDVIVPIVGMLSVTMLVIPVLVAAALAVGVDEEGLAAAAGARPRLALEPITGPVTVVRSSSMYFKNVTDNVAAHEGESDVVSAEAVEGSRAHTLQVLEVSPSGAGDIESGAVEEGTHSTTAAGSAAGGGSSRLCYVCMSMSPNAVILGVCCAE